MSRPRRCQLQRAARRVSFARLALAASLACGMAGSSTACPFCTALKPTLNQMREQAAVVALAEVDHQATGPTTKVHIHRVLAGANQLKPNDSLELKIDVTAKPGALLLVFGVGAPKSVASGLAWSAVVVNEVSYAYFVRSPSLKGATAERLRYFAPFLEHAEPLVAEDAYLEFGHAPFDQVAGVADVFPMPRLRAWLIVPQVPPERKGFYGLALGLAPAKERQANADFLRRQIVAPEDDFRAGFDGVLGGYLLLTGSAGLELIEERYLANPEAKDGDIRHALTALRFYHEFGHDIPAPRLQKALRRLLARPEFAADALTDLARWKDWSIVDEATKLYTRAGYDQPAIRRAIVGYLLACPDRAAVQSLGRLRNTDAAGVATAEQEVSQTSGSLKSAE